MGDKFSNTMKQGKDLCVCFRAVAKLTSWNDIPAVWGYLRVSFLFAHVQQLLSQSGYLSRISQLGAV